jgi:hypothetical protein
MEMRTFVAVALVLVIALVLAAAVRHASREEGGFAGPLNKPRSKTKTGESPETMAAVDEAPLPRAQDIVAD